MKLSEAIRLGAMLKPQAFGSLFNGMGTCALGAAADAVGILDTDTHWFKRDKRAPEHWKPVATSMAECPQCGADWPLPRTGAFTKRDVQTAVVHLNNDHRWTRERIADWVATIEAQQEPSTESPAPVAVEA